MNKKEKHENCNIIVQSRPSRTVLKLGSITRGGGEISSLKKIYIYVLSYLFISLNKKIKNVFEMNTLLLHRRPSKLFGVGRPSSTIPLDSIICLLFTYP